MARRLSTEAITAFCGDVRPLRLLGGQPYANDPIRWFCDNKKTVQITSFAKQQDGAFTDGVLLTFLAVGEAAVTATVDGKTYSCKVTVREMRHTASSASLTHFVGDMHDHTWTKHNLAEFSARTPDLYPINHYMKKMKEDGRMDFGVVSDHASVLNSREFFRGYADAEECGEQMVFFPGCEGQVTQRETDRYGVTHMHGGEVLMFNADTAFATDSWDGLFQGLKNSPFAFCGYPHPQIIGYSVNGIWDFRHRENNSRKFTNLFRFVEMGDGSSRQANMINEYIYSVALDEGFRVSPTCSSDAHGDDWGYDCFPGKTVLMAAEKSKEAFLDAILHNRMYATSTGNVKVVYTVNGKTAPATLAKEGIYRFHVELDYFRANEPDTHIRRCKVITDKGITAAETENAGDRFDLTVVAPQSHYFYLCLLDEMGRKTWSCPVWTGKSFTRRKATPLVPIPKSGITVFDAASKKAAPELINDDVHTLWRTTSPTADLIFDLGKEQTVSAVSHYPQWIDARTLQAHGLQSVDVLKEFPSAYRISVSRDGTHYKTVNVGQFRVFGWEETVRLKSHKARFVRIEINSTVGKEWAEAEFADAALTIAELTLWQNA